MSNRILTSAIGVAVIGAASIFGGEAVAGRRVVDHPPSAFPTAGSGWNYHDIDLTDDASCDKSGGPCAIPLGFSINFGTGPVNEIYLNENGVASFGGALPSGTKGQGSLNSLGQPVIAPFYTDLVSIAHSDDDVGEIAWGDGRIDLAEDPDPSNDTSPVTFEDAQAAFRADWNGVTRAHGGSDEIYAQIVIIDQGGGDFDLMLNHGLEYPSVTKRKGAKVGLLLGSNEFKVTGGSIDNSEELFFKFRGGVLVE